MCKLFKISTYSLKMINDEHNALSPEYLAFKRMLQEEKRKIGWEDVKKQLQRKSLILYTNAQNFMAHKNEIQHLMKKRPTFIALSETRLITKIEDSEVNVSDYSMIRCDAENRNTGGVVLFIRDNI